MQDQLLEQTAALYRQHAPALLRYLARIAGADQAQDLLQDTFLQLVRRPARLRQARSPQAWLFGAARHLAYSAMRRSTRRFAVETSAPPAEPPAAEDPRLPTVREAIRKLPAEQQETLWLRLEGELSYEEIAAVLQIPVGTVRSRLHNAVRRLQQMLGSSSEPATREAPLPHEPARP